MSLVRVTEEVAEALVEPLRLVLDADQRIRLMHDFVTEFGLPNRLPVARLEEAERWVKVRTTPQEEDAPPPEMTLEERAEALRQRVAAGKPRDVKQASAGGGS